MSQTTHTVEAVKSSNQFNEFSYRPVPPLAPVSVFIGLCSMISLGVVVGLGIAVIGIILSTLCLMQIRRSSGELGGKMLASAGMALSIVFLISGSSLHAYNYSTEVPEGFRRVNFLNDISKKEFVIEERRRALHADVRPFVDENIFIKGYIYNTKTSQNMSSFVLLKDSGACCFGGNPKPWDMILVKMQEGKTVDFMTGLVSVAGVLRADPSASPGNPVYTLEGTHFERARTRF